MSNASRYVPTEAEIAVAMKVLHVSRNPPNEGRHLPFDQLPALTLKALEIDARAALAIAAEPQRFYPL